MTEVSAYYDGNSVQLLERIPAKKNQLLKIFVTNDFVKKENSVSSLRGYFHKNTSPEMRAKEKSAWANCAKDKIN